MLFYLSFCFPSAASVEVLVPEIIEQAAAAAVGAVVLAAVVQVVVAVVVVVVVVTEVAEDLEVNLLCCLGGMKDDRKKIMLKCLVNIFIAS